MVQTVRQTLLRSQVACNEMQASVTDLLYSGAHRETALAKSKAV